jgi:hypothetical protein
MNSALLCDHKIILARIDLVFQTLPRSISGNQASRVMTDSRFQNRRVALAVATAFDFGRYLFVGSKDTLELFYKEATPDSSILQTSVSESIEQRTFKGMVTMGSV